MVKPICALLFLVAFWLVPLSSAQSKHGRVANQFLPYTRNLPAIDKVELLQLKTHGDLWDGEIAESKTLTGAEAQNLATLWRGETFFPWEAACHNPAYAVKFYAGEKLLVYSSICWDCNNMRFLTPGLKGSQSFDGRGKKGQQLLRIFRAAFPNKK